MRGARTRARAGVACAPARRLLARRRARAPRRRALLTRAAPRAVARACAPLVRAQLFVATVREYHEWQARSRQALLDMRIEDSRSAAEIELQEALGAELRALEEEHARARAAQSQSSLAASTLALTARTSDEAAATTAGAADDPDAMESDDAGGGM